VKPITQPSTMDDDVKTTFIINVFFLLLITLQFWLTRNTFQSDVELIFTVFRLLYVEGIPY
jgi:hypothetical protein